MSEAGDLYALAEISVTIAGFAALVSVLARRTGDFDPNREGLRLIIALECSLFIAAFALFPIILHRFGVAVEATWRLSSLVYLLSDIVFALLIARRTRAVAELWPSRALARAIWSGSAIGQLSLLLAVFGVAIATPQAFFFFTLYVNLLITGLLFLIVAWQTFVPGDSTAV